MANVTPIQTGDGSQEAVASAFRVGDFGPSPTPDLKTNVAAPLDVRGAPGQATFLAAQLQQSLQSMRWPLMSMERIQGMQRAQQMATQGRGDADSGNINQELMAKDSAYQRGAMTTLGQKYGYQLAQWAQQQIKNPNSGWAGMDQQQLMSQLDAQARKTMGGMETNPDFAVAAAPIVQHIHNEVLGWKVKAQHDNDVSQMRSNTGSALTMAAQGGPAFNYASAFAQYRNVFGGDGALASSTLNQDIVSYAVANHDANALDTITPAPGQSALAPKTALLVSEARDGINRYNAEQNSQAIQQRQFGILAQWDNSLAAKTPISQAAIQEAVNNHDISSEAGLAYLSKSDELKERMQATTAAGTATGPWYTMVGTQIPGAKPGRMYTKQDFQDSVDQAIGKLPQEQRIGAAVRMTQTQGLTYTPLQSTLSNEPLNTAQGVKDVLGAYQGMTSIDPTVTARYFSDPKRLAEVRQLQQLQQSGMSADDIASYVQKHGFGQQSADGVGAKAADINKSLATWTIQGGHFWNGGSITLNDLANPGQVQARVTARAHQLAESGICTPATCVSQAQQQVLDESYVIKLASGHSLVTPRAANDPPPALSQPALQWFYASQIGNVAKAGGYQGNPSGLRLVPNTAQPGTYSVLTSTGLPASRDTFTLQGITAAWLKSKAATVAAQQQTAAARAVQREQAEQQALSLAGSVK